MQHGFRIGEAYHVEPSLNRVTGPGGITRLEPKVMLVLVCLAERAGQMVTKDRLLQSAWADTAVGDDVLTRAISELRRLFDDDPKQPRVIETIPKAGYRLVAPVTTSTEAVVPAVAPAVTNERDARTSPRVRRLSVIAAITIGLLVLGLAWQFRSARTTPTPQPAMRVVPLTAMNGSEFGPAFSPDGRQVAFSWNGERQDNFDIYVKLVGSSEVRRLTTDPGMDFAPQWSADGLQVAYVRVEPDLHSMRVRVMSSLGGSDRKVSDFPVWRRAAWSPDGRYLVAGRADVPDAAHPTNGIYLIPLQGGEPRAITQPKPPGLDQLPAFSPDGHRLAYASCDEYRTDCHLQVVDLDSVFATVGSPRQLTGALRMPQSSLSWSSDGGFVLFNAEEVQLNYLWRVAADGERPPERIEIAGVNAFFPSPSPAGDRLVFTRAFHDEDVYSFEPGRSAQPVARSSVFDGSPQFSADGRRIAFCSLRSGDGTEVWVANADGSTPEQLTHGPGRYQCGPSWSPDGREIAFQSDAADGQTHIWTVDSEGGTPHQITSDPGVQMAPAWSRDGEWVYFSWIRQPGFAGSAAERDQDIWRTSVRTGSKARVTHDGGFVSYESVDRKTLLYLPKPFNSPLMAQPLDGGTPRQVIRCVAGTAFSVGRTGIYYVPCSGPSPDPDPSVHVIDPGTGTDRELGRLEKFQYASLPSGFDVSPDGRTILYGRLVRSEADLMMIENFK